MLHTAWGAVAVIPVQGNEIELLPSGLYDSTAYLEIVDPNSGVLLHRVRLLNMEDNSTSLIDNVDAVVTPDGTKAIIPVQSKVEEVLPSGNLGAAAYLEIVDITTGTLLNRVRLLTVNDNTTYLINDIDVVLTPDGTKAAIPVETDEGETAHFEIVDITTGTLQHRVKLLNQIDDITYLVSGVDAVLTPDGTKAIIPVDSETAYIEIVDIASGLLQHRVRLLNQNSDPTILIGDIDAVITPDGTKVIMPVQSATDEVFPGGVGKTAYLEIVDIGTGTLAFRVQLLTQSDDYTLIVKGVDTVLIPPGGTKAVIPVQGGVPEPLPSGNTDYTAYLEVVNITTGTLISRVQLLSTTDDGTDIVRDVDVVISQDNARAVVAVQGRWPENFPNVIGGTTAYLEIIDVTADVLESQVRIVYFEPFVGNHPIELEEGVDPVFTLDGSKVLIPVQNPGNIGPSFMYWPHLFKGTAYLAIIDISPAALIHVEPLLNSTLTPTQLIPDVDAVLTPDGTRALVLVASEGYEPFPLGDCIIGCKTPYLQIIDIVPSIPSQYLLGRVRLLNNNNTQTVPIDGVDPALTPDGTKALVPVQSQEYVKLQLPGQTMPVFDHAAYIDIVNVYAPPLITVPLYKVQLLDLSDNPNTAIITGVDVTGHGSAIIGDVMDADADMAPDEPEPLLLPPPSLPDFGDADDPFNNPPNTPLGGISGNYPTLLANNGARHKDFTKEWLGDWWTHLAGGICSTNPSATGELDSNNFDTDALDDGVVIWDPAVGFFPIPTTQLQPGNLYIVDILVSTSGLGALRYDPTDPNTYLYLHGYFDWDGNGTWANNPRPEFHIALSPSAPGWIPAGGGGFGWVIPGPGNDCARVLVPIAVPIGANIGKFFARYRLDYGEDVSWQNNISGNLFEEVGEAQFGEVEDYPYDIIPPPGDGDGGGGGGTKSGYKWRDDDGDGFWDPIEPPLGGWGIVLSKNGIPISITSTDHNGYYEFKNLPIGSYKVCENVPPGWVQTFPPGGCHIFTISSSGEVHTNNNFGNKPTDVPPTCKWHKYGWKWNDKNGNGKWDAGEPGMDGWIIIALGNDLTGNPVLRVEITRNGGFYQFNNLPCGEYDIFELLLPGWVQTYPPGGKYHEKITIAENGIILKDNNFGNRMIEIPTAIRLSDFHVNSTGNKNTISWTTGAEIDTEGFHILRSTTPGGQYSGITPSMIASTGSGFSGGKYSFVDMAVEDGKSYYYKLEEVDSKGNIAHYGPVAALADQGEGGSADLYGRRQLGGTIVGDKPPRYDGGKDVAAGFSLRPQAAPVYTIMAYAEGPAKFLSGEVVDEETVQGIRSQVLDPPHLTSPRRGEEKDVVEGKRRVDGAGSIPAFPTSIRFRIIDADGNEVAVASLEAEDAKSGDFALQNRWDGGRVILTWYANKPVKGFHILRSTAKDGQYQQITKTLIPYIGTGIEGVTGQIFRFTYTDRNVQKGKDYYYKLEPVLREDGKTALRQK